MAADTATVFESFFRELGSRGIASAILHSYEQMPEQMPSDIDFAVRCDDLPKLVPVAREIAGRHGWVLASVVQAKLWAQYVVLVDPDDPRRFLQLDACGHYAERGCLVLRDEELLRGCRPRRSFQVASAASEFGYRLAKALLKEKPLEPSLPRLRELWKTDPAGSNEQFRQLVGSSVGGLEPWFDRRAVEWERELYPRLRARNRFGLADRMRECWRAARRILHPAGMQVVILGPDGVGKSTVISQLTLPCFRAARQFHFRPGVLGKKMSTPVSQPHAQSPRSAISGVAKILYYFADHWIGYCWRIFPCKVRRELVIFDRSFEDVLVDPRRYRLSRPSALARWLRKLLPSPDLTIVLDAEPGLVHARKPELAIEELRRQREVLQQMAAGMPRWRVISATHSSAEVAREVQREILQFLAQRENRRQVG